MSEETYVWSCDELVRHVRNDDPEVRYWAIDRLTRHYPEACCDAIQGFLLDDHDATPALVARHLGEYGGTAHRSILTRGFRLLRGTTPGLCMQALVKLRAPNVAELAMDALKSGSLEEPALAMVVESLSEAGSPECEEVVREVLRQKPSLMVEPPALRGALRVSAVTELDATVQQFLTAMQWKGIDRAGEAFRILMDELKIDDAAWCFRTGPSGPIELRKTIKAVEAGYDCDIQAIVGDQTINRLAQRFRVGNVADTVRSLADWTASATPEMRVPPESDLPMRISAVVSGFAEKTALERAQRLGPQFLQWLLGFQLSAAFAVARYQTREWTMKQARGRLEPLLELAEVETAFHLADMPREIVAACEDNRILRDRAQDWCLRLLEAQGPFFPKVVALETLGELGAVHFTTEVMDYLSEENSYIYGAAERALAKLGEAIVPAAVQRIETGQLDPDAAHSVLVLLCDLGTTSAFEAVMRHLDTFMDIVGPGAAAEWVSLFGAEELIDPLRDWLDHDKPMIGQAILLLGAIHNVRIPEEDEIVQAIEDERARQAAAEARDGSTLTDDIDGDYVM